MKEALELVKAGYENAQARIAFMDSKVGVVSAFLLVIIPGPWAMLGWLVGMEKERSAAVIAAVKSCPFPALLGAVGVLTGSALGLMALLHAIECAQPRGPKPVPGSLAQCNVIFPAVPMVDAELLDQHLRQLGPGMPAQFPLDQYKEQLMQVGWILEAKLSAMKRCFQMTRWSVLCSFFSAAVFLFYLVVGLVAK